MTRPTGECECKGYIGCSGYLYGEPEILKEQEGEDN